MQSKTALFLNFYHFRSIFNFTGKENKKNYQNFSKIANQIETINFFTLDNTIIKIETKDNDDQEIDLNSSVSELIEKYCDNQSDVSEDVKKVTLDIFKRAQELK